MYRLEVLPLRVASLAVRACQAHRFGRLKFSPAGVQAGLCAEWPGNVRQLEHAVAAAVIRAAGGGGLTIEREHLFPNHARTTEPRSAQTLQQATRQFQERLLMDTLRDTGWNVKQTAEKLDIARSHVYSLIRSFGLERLP